jgi:hypothetical protein
LPVLPLPPSLSIAKRIRICLWANGDANYDLRNSDYNFWTAGDGSVENPVVVSLPVKDTGSLTKFSQVIPGVGRLNESGTFTTPGTESRYWSDTPANTNTGYNMVVYTTIGPVRNNATSAYGLSIRCVRI